MFHSKLIKLKKSTTQIHCENLNLQSYRYENQPLYDTQEPIKQRIWQQNFEI